MDQNHLKDGAINQSQPPAHYFPWWRYSVNRTCQPGGLGSYLFRFFFLFQLITCTDISCHFYQSQRWKALALLWEHWQLQNVKPRACPTGASPQPHMNNCKKSLQRCESNVSRSWDVESKWQMLIDAWRMRPFSLEISTLPVVCNAWHRIKYSHVFSFHSLTIHRSSAHWKSGCMQSHSCRLQINTYIPYCFKWPNMNN